MASSEHIKALLKSHLDRDDDRFLSIALQVAAHEARSGHGKLAQELRDIVERARKRPAARQAVPIAKALRDTSGLLSATTPNLRLGDLVAPDALKDRLARVVREQRHAAKLKNHGLQPRRKLLLVGPPGTGKTFTASILAGELGYPLFQVRLDALITRYMGETSAKLRQVFDALADVRGVYFFDEFDALGSQRSATNDVGEARRILNSFLQMIEQDASNSLIVCATNHEEILDYALFRRFDDVGRYRLPGPEEIERLLKDRLGAYVPSSFDWEQAVQLSQGLSSAETTLVAQDALKEMLIEDATAVTLLRLEATINERRGMAMRPDR
jgi:SpoVK/Ycf46/Vps4 family AAA+-type ATPase